MTYEYENLAKQDGYKTICGVDEAGRGPLAGPVFAAAVILPEGLDSLGINDSKKLTEKKRNKLFETITSLALSYSVAMVGERDVDEKNIVNATFEAMKKAVNQMKIKPDFILVDGNLCPGTGIPEKAIVKGDSKSLSIAAASILAKVSRDRYMETLDELYPEYGFAKHKGYGTAYHYEMIRKFGISPVHRRSFLKKIIGENNDR